MASTYKVLGQSTGSIAQTVLYQVPSASQAVVSSLVIANLGSATRAYRLAVQPASASLDPKHYLAYDVAISGSDSVALTLGISLASTDVLSIYASQTGSVAFTAFGSEIV